jgi:hypothetical protein
MQKKTRRGWMSVDTLALIGFCCGLVFLVFVVGVITAHRNWLPSRWIRNASEAAGALVAQRALVNQEFPDYLWFPARSSECGLITRDAARSYPGWTMYAAADEGSAILLDDEGRELHRWSAPFSRVWPQAQQLQGWAPDRCIYIRRTHVFPTGDLLALYETPSQTPNGCGLARLDRHGRPIWTFDANAHHDFCVSPNGKVYVLTHRFRSKRLPNWEQLQPPFIEEFLTVLSSSGQVQKSLSLFKLLGESPFHRPLVTFTDQLGDVLHSNSVQLVNAGFAQHHGGVSPGDLMVCLRNVNLVIIINPQMEQIVWATTGPWRLPHDPDPLSDGSILIFDNCYARGRLHGSRVLRFQPLEGIVQWQYPSRSDQSLRSDIRACQQHLPNGNVLITESDQGRILEVTPDGEVAWEYVHPVRGGNDGQLIPIVTGAFRYDPSELPFLEQNPSRGEESSPRHTSPAVGRADSAVLGS